MYLLYHTKTMPLSKIYDIGRLYPTTQRVVGFTLPFYKKVNGVPGKL